MNFGKLILVPIALALLGFIGYQAYCRIVYAQDFASLCKDAATRKIRDNMSMENFKWIKVDKVTHTWDGLRVTGGYELEKGAGSRGYSCTCSCAKLDSELMLTIY